MEEWSVLGNRDIDGHPPGSGRAVGQAASQSAYWLKLLVESGVVSVEKLAPLRQECEELTGFSSRLFDLGDVRRGEAAERFAFSQHTK